jgi:hypothetical protein
MLGGQESFARGGYGRTPVSNLLPVYLDRASHRSGAPALRLELTREGWLHPWVRLRETEAEERERLSAMPAFLSANSTGAIKPGAMVMATAYDESGTRYPALAVQRYGQGRAAALTIGDAWRWKLHSQPSNGDLGKAWRQLVRWLVADVPQRIDLRTQDRRDAGQQLTSIQVRVRDEQFQPLPGATAILTVHAPDGSQVQLPGKASPREVGLFEATYAPRLAGAYRVTAEVTGERDQDSGTAETGWVSDTAAAEFRSLRPDRELLEALAHRTEGEMVAPEDLEAFVSDLPNRRMPVTASWVSPLWHHPFVFLVALVCLVAEWGIRRWKGLP